MSQNPSSVKHLQRHFLQEQERAAQVQTSSQNRSVGRFDTAEIENDFDKQLNSSKVTTKSNLDNINKIDQSQLSAMEQEAIEYAKQKKLEEFRMKKRREKMEVLFKEEILKVIGNSEWNKSKIQRWMQEIIDSAGEILDQYLSNLGVFKYAIDVIILKSTALAKQSENLMTPQTDYSFNIKVKNGFGLIVLLNTHAFKVANI